MLKRILVPLDGSPQAEQAIPFAARMARASGGTVVLARALQLPGADQLPSTARTSWAFMAQTWADIAHTYLAHAATLPSLADVRTETAVSSGHDAQTILAVAQEQGADAIVLCSQGHPSVRDWGLDEMARLVIRDATIPVLAIPDQGLPLDLDDEDQTRTLRAMVALDGSVQAEGVLDQAVRVVASLAAPGPAALHLVHVTNTSSANTSGADDDADERAVEDARAYLSAVAYDLRTSSPAGQFLTPTWSVARDRDVVRAVLAQASHLPTTSPTTGEDDASAWTPYDPADNGELDDGELDTGEFEGTSWASALGADLIVMATYGRRGPRGWETDGIVESVLRLAARPVLILRPPVRESPPLPLGAYRFEQREIGGSLDGAALQAYEAADEPAVFEGGIG